jgi:purine-binding chemotaxis protein CheW
MDIAKIRKKLKETKPDNQDSISGRIIQEETEKAGITEQEKPPEEFTPDDETRENETAATADAKGEEKTGGVSPVKTEDSDAAKTDGVIEILTFSLLKVEFAFKISQLAEIIRPQTITVVPQLPKYVLGVTSLRGKVIPVLDLKLKLSLTDVSLKGQSKEKILILKGPKGPIGATIDRVIGVVRVGRNEIIPPPSHLTEAEIKFIEGIAVVDKSFISIINIDEAIAIDFT